MSQEQRQAAILVLLDPVAQSASLDLVLSVLNPATLNSRFSALNEFEQDLVRSWVYRELTGDKNPDSIRNLYVCASSGICPVTQPEGQGEVPGVVNDASRYMTSLIRTQHWEALGL